MRIPASAPPDAYKRYLTPATAAGYERCNGNNEDSDVPCRSHKAPEDKEGQGEYDGDKHSCAPSIHTSSLTGFFFAYSSSSTFRSEFVLARAV